MIAESMPMSRLQAVNSKSARRQPEMLGCRRAAQPDGWCQWSEDFADRAHQQHEWAARGSVVQCRTELCTSTRRSCTSQWRTCGNVGDRCEQIGDVIRRLTMLWGPRVLVHETVCIVNLLRDRKPPGAVHEERKIYVITLFQVEHESRSTACIVELSDVVPVLPLLNLINQSTN